MKTHFGFEEIPEEEKAKRVGQVFSSVVTRYDLMNDLMSLGLHRWWKTHAVTQAGVRAGDKVLDIAAGTGDLARAFARRGAEVIVSDINFQMLTVGRDRSLDQGALLPAVQCDAEKLPFGERHFDCISVAFGLRNMTRLPAALAEMHRVLRPGGRLLILEFSHIWRPLAPAYDWYSFKILPWLGDRVAKDRSSYRYLAESIRRHPDQETMCQLLQDAGFTGVRFHNLSAGVVALHLAQRAME